MIPTEGHFLEEKAQEIARYKVRSLFLSDIHLGTRACQSHRLLEFIKQYDCEYLFLVGDIVDFWALKRGIYWPAEHNTVVQKILRLARHGVKVIYVPGNHDEALREYLDAVFGDIAVRGDCVHTAADGRRYALTHGDQYDQVTTYARWLSVLGDVSYHALVHMNRLLSLVRRKLGVTGHWSLADYAKRNVLKAVSFVGDFEQAVARGVRERGLDGVICGHIHTPVIKDVDGVLYMNCGDWVDSCSAVIERLDGSMQLVRHVPAVAVGDEEVTVLAESVAV
jgi:UDP-2,3-diacylglucosamine pyrophosphatase LpxH